MRRVNYKEFREKVKREGFYALQTVNRRAPRRRPRDPGEAENLRKLAKLSWDRALASQKIEKTGERRYRLNIYEE